MQTVPFKRAKAMQAKIAEIIKSVPAHLQQMALAELGEYKSRGHGIGKISPNYRGHDGKYKPHQGKRECARRVRQSQIAN